MRLTAKRLYERLLEREISRTPAHVAVIQDGNRRYARQHGGDANEGHREGAKTTEQLLEWCYELGIEELTLYAFSTENFRRPEEEREALFDLLEEKLNQYAEADEIHEYEVRIRAIGDLGQMPDRAREAIENAESATENYDNFTLNVALAYGGRRELLSAATAIAEDVDRGELDPEAIDVETVEDRLYGQENHLRDVDLVVRTGGDERTSNFLPWHGTGSEAAVFFCAPYWPEFDRSDFLRGIRTYQHREQSWRRTRARRALALVRSFENDLQEVSEEGIEHARLQEARRILRRLGDSLPRRERPPELDDEDLEEHGQPAD
jgi:tritrans,polycis-undecaprenyl-diphosphate synthase [geranylgeranyl-diphosphate specific]